MEDYKRDVILFKMIILNACKDVKVDFTDEVSLLLFSPRILTQSDHDKLCITNRILMEQKMDQFLSSFPHSWVYSEDKAQLYAVKVEADEDICRSFLSESLRVDAKVFLEDE